MVLWTFHKEHAINGGLFKVAWFLLETILIGYMTALYNNESQKY